MTTNTFFLEGTRWQLCTDFWPPSHHSFTFVEVSFRNHLVLRDPLMKKTDEWSTKTNIFARRNPNLNPPTSNITVKGWWHPMVVYLGLLPENGWLEYDRFLFGDGNCFQGRSVSFGGAYIKITSSSKACAAKLSASSSLSLWTLSSSYVAFLKLPFLMPAANLASNLLILSWTLY